MKRLLSLVILLPLILSCSRIGCGNGRHVNMFLGTAGDHGQMAPGAAVPFGMISVCPDSNPNQHGGYDYDVPEISGISVNRISGVGCWGTGGNIRVKPSLPETCLKIVKSTEKAHPGYYEATFDNGVTGCFTATKNMAVEKYAFPSGAERVLSVDFLSSLDFRDPSLVTCAYEFTGDGRISGYVQAPTACAAGSYRLFFMLDSDTPFECLASDKGRVLLGFAEDVKEVEIRIALSPVDVGCAEMILDRHSERSFGSLHREAKGLWKDKLAKIKVYGSTREQKGMFYTFLYRVYLSPMDVMSEDGRYKGTDGEIYSSDAFRYYSSWSMWDTFRAKFPLLAVLEPEVMDDVCRSVVEQYRCGKRNWATEHESVPTVRTEHSSIMLLDCWRKGIRGFSFVPGYEGMKREAAELLLDSPDRALEGSYDLWALAQIADIIGRTEDAAAYRVKADSLFDATWPKEFMNVTPDFVRMKDNGLYQGSRWQFRWAAPHYLDRMVELSGKDKLEKELDHFFAENLINQGNEPGIHTPFIFNLLGSPHKTQDVVRRMLTDDNMVHRYGGNAEYPEPFVGRAFRNAPDGLAPEMDEDDGTMSAWYVFCSIGFYPVVVGTDRYEAFSPLYDKIVIDNGSARTVIRAIGRKNQDDIIKSVSIDGKPLEDLGFSHDVFRKGARIKLEY